jgi:hypothetical protein
MMIICEAFVQVDSVLVQLLDLKEDLEELTLGTSEDVVFKVSELKVAIVLAELVTFEHLVARVALNDCIGTL